MCVGRAYRTYILKCPGHLVYLAPLLVDGLPEMVQIPLRSKVDVTRCIEVQRREQHVSFLLGGEALPVPEDPPKCVVSPLEHYTYTKKLPAILLKCPLSKH